MTMDKLQVALEDALKLYRWKPGPIERGGSAGSRDEGVYFRDKMRPLIAVARPHALVETSIAKSSGGERVEKLFRVHHSLSRSALRSSRLACCHARHCPSWKSRLRAGPLSMHASAVRS